MHPPPHNTVRDPGKSIFLLRLSVWLAGYLVIVVAWGSYNAWPSALAVCLVFFPVNLALAGWLYHSNGFTVEVQSHVLEWDSLIAFLILAIGVASGLLLLLAVGWVGVGAVYLRPARPETAWDEWFKLPVLFLSSLPAGLDVAGSRYDWLRYFNIEGIDLWLASPGRLPVLEFQMTAWLGLYALVFWLSGGVFWFCLPLLPVLLFAASQLILHLTPGRIVLEHPGFLAGATATLNLLVVAALILLGRRWLRAHPEASARWRAVSHWARIRSRAPWLAALVIVVQQSSLAEGWLARHELRFNAAGAALLLGVLLWRRWRQRGGAVHPNTRILLVLSLFVLLAAEWTDLEPLRGLSLGILLVGLASWRRAWRGRVILAALFTWTMTIPVGADVLVYTGLSGSTVAVARSVCFVVGLLGVVALSRRSPPPASAEVVDDWGWQPLKRFGFILLCLLLGFQVASAFWRDRSDGAELGIHLTPGIAAGARAAAVTSFPRSSRTHRFRIRWEDQEFQLVVIRPVDIPIRLSSPELMFGATGWRVLHRHLIARPRGQAVELRLTRGGRIGCALYWFENGDRAFADYLRARRILWSGWNLTHRDLRLVLLQAPTLTEPERLVRFAQGQDWFRAGRIPVEGAPRTTSAIEPAARGSLRVED